jgi:hypothetical protein
MDMDLPRVYTTMTQKNATFVYKDDFVFFAKPNANKKDPAAVNYCTKQSNCNKEDHTAVNYCTKQSNYNKEDLAAVNVVSGQANANYD